MKRSRKIVTRGLVLLLLAGLVTVGCRSKAPVSRGIPPTVENICGWPEYCHPEPASMMLQVIQDLAQASFDQGEIEEALRERVFEAVKRCRDPMLHNAAGRHVCHLQDPEPCGELQDIKAHAEDMAYPPMDPKMPGGPMQPATPARHWGTIAQELENFPTGQ